MAQNLQTFLDSRLEDEVVARISGNAPREIKEIPVKWLSIFHNRKISFAYTVTERIEVVEVSIVRNSEDQLKMDGRVVCEIDVTSGSRQASFFMSNYSRPITPDMLNAAGAMHEGCAVLLIDEYEF
jgi:acyl-coenzyme A thioesterase 13